MIVTKAILVKVGLEVFRRYGMINAIDTTLDQRPPYKLVCRKCYKELKENE